MEIYIKEDMDEALKRLKHTWDVLYLIVNILKETHK